MHQPAWLIGGLFLDAAILGMAAYLWIANGRWQAQGTFSHARKYLVQGMFLAGLALLGVLLFFILPDRVIKTNEITRAQYNGLSADPKFSQIQEYSDNENAPQREITLHFKMMVPEIHGYDNVFQTSAGNNGIRMELSPAGQLDMAVGDGTQVSFQTYTVIPKVKAGQWYAVQVDIDKNKNIEIHLNHKKILRAQDRRINYALDEFALGAGFSKTRVFHGEVKDFTLKYRLSENSWVERMALAALYVIMLYLLALYLLSIYPGSGTKPLAESFRAEGQRIKARGADIFALLGKHRARIMALLGLACLTMLLYYVLPDRVIKTRTIKDIQYNSASADPQLSQIKAYGESAHSQLIETTIQFKMKAQAVNDYGNIFQTSSVNLGIRMELSPPGSLGITISDGTGMGYRAYTLIPQVQPGQWYAVRVEIDKNKNFQAYVNSQKVMRVYDPQINYDMNDIVIGAGYSRTRVFHGEIAGFTLQYRLLDDLAKRSITTLIITGMLAFLLLSLVNVFPLPNHFSQTGKSAAGMDQTFFLIGLATFFGVVAGIYGIVHWLPQFYHPQTDPGLVRLLTQDAISQMCPEPMERMRYAAGVAATPFLILVFWSLFSRIFSWLKLRAAVRSLVYWGVVSGSVLGLLVFSFYLLGQNPVYFGASEAIKKPWVLILAPAFFIICGYLVTRPVQQTLTIRLAKGAFYISTAGIIGFLVITHLFGKGGYPGVAKHFDAVFYSVSQVLGGKTLLVDCISQYGLYPHFIEPILRLAGGTVVHFSILMSLLLGISFLLLAWVLNRVLKNRLLAFLGFLTVVYTVFEGKLFWFDVFYQYFPIRILFPYLLLFLITNYFVKPRALLYGGMLLAAALGLLWNLDTGLIAFFSVISALVYSEWIQPEVARWHRVQKSLQHIAAGLGMAVAVIAGYSAFAFVRSGSFPQFAWFMVYQNVFYQSGLCMMPMPGIHPWHFVLAIYLVGLLYSFKQIVFPNKEKYIKAVIVFFVSILGTGIFTYYQGRSHEINLILVSYPAWILAALFADDIWESLLVPGAGRFDRIPYLILILFIFTLPFVSLFEKSGQYAAFIKRGVSSLQATSQVLDDYIVLVKKHSHPGDKVFIDSSAQSAILHAESQTISALNVPGPAELVLQKDIDTGHAFLETNTKYPVFIDLAENIYLTSLPRSVLFYVADKSQDGKFIELIKTEDEESKLRFFASNESCLLEYAPKFKSGYSEAVLFPQMALPGKFLLEILIKPSAKQVNHAAILGNAAGTDSKGFSLQYNPTQPNGYRFSFGSKNQESLAFELAPDSWHYIVVAVNSNRVEYYHNGTNLKSICFAAPLENSANPLFIGNDFSQNSPFNGQIKEVCLRKNIFSREQILNNWKYIQRRLALEANRN